MPYSEIFFANIFSLFSIMDRTVLYVALILLFNNPPVDCSDGSEDNGKGLLKYSVNRKNRLIPVFNVITFNNDPCGAAQSRNGTCFTPLECSARNGIAVGSCASGYGVCCVIVLGCGGISNTNCTYVEQSTISDVNGIASNPCSYTICKCSSSICRLRLDFITNLLAPPQTGLQTAGNAQRRIGGALGDCLTDTMVLSSPGGQSSPVICGFNTGQHMIVDMSDFECNVLTFKIGSSANVQRQWNIKATQFECNDDNGSGGPPGCLQYFRESMGTVASYNFNTANDPIDPTTTHLSNQEYDICFRRGEGNCQICYTPARANSYGLSRSINVKSGVGTRCTEDWITIPEGTAVNAAVIGTPPSGKNRFCGRVLAVQDNQANGATVCSIIVPFILGVKFNANERTVGQNDPNMNELSMIPGGSNGFFLGYKQISCL